MIFGSSRAGAGQWSEMFLTPAPLKLKIESLCPMSYDKPGASCVSSPWMYLPRHSAGHSLVEYAAKRAFLLYCSSPANSAANVASLMGEWSISFATRAGCGVPSHPRWTSVLS
eukprot:scaffold61059_cov99-Phaeocystis_antarctica.AAC.1